MAVESIKSTVAQSYAANVASNVPDVQTDATEQIEAVESVNAVTDSSTGAKDEDLLVSEKEPSDSTIKQAVKDINKKMNNTIAEFGYHEGTHRVTIRIKDKDTQKVVKEIPAEKTLDMIEKAWELAGILVDEKR